MQLDTQSLLAIAIVLITTYFLGGAFTGIAT